jgi:hypothetical protein
MLSVKNEGCSSTTRGGGDEDSRHEGINYQPWYFAGVPIEYTSPPIRDGATHIPKLISHEPPLPTGTSSSLSLTTKKNGEEGFCDGFYRASATVACGSHSLFFLMGDFPLLGTSRKPKSDFPPPTGTTFTKRAKIKFPTGRRRPPNFSQPSPPPV